MRILNDDTNEAISSAVIILTIPEAAELRDKIEQLNKRKMALDHSHINDQDYEKEITVSIYDVQSSEGYVNRFQKLILEDK